MNEPNLKPQPDIFVLIDHTKSIYQKMIHYAETFGKKPVGTDTVTYVNQIIDTVFSQKNHKHLMVLLHTEKDNGFTALDFYFMKLIKQEI